jgi:hypothetical protein
MYLYIYICIRHQHTYILCVLYPNFPPDPPTLFFWFLFHGVVGSYCMQSVQVQSEPDSSTFNCSILMSFGLGNDFQMDFSRVTLCIFSAGKCLSTRQTIWSKGARGTKRRIIFAQCAAHQEPFAAVCEHARQRSAQPFLLPATLVTLLLFYLLFFVLALYSRTQELHRKDAH